MFSLDKGNSKNTGSTEKLSMTRSVNLSNEIFVSKSEINPYNPPTSLDDKTVREKQTTNTQEILDKHNNDAKEIVGVIENLADENRRLNIVAKVSFTTFVASSFAMTKVAQSLVSGALIYGVSAETLFPICLFPLLASGFASFVSIGNSTSRKLKNYTKALKELFQSVE